MNGKKVFDPRIQQIVLSDNPALILADCLESLIKAYDLPEVGEYFINWQAVSEAADQCDRKR